MLALSTQASAPAGFSRVVPYEYLHHQFSLDINMPAGRARVWLRFSVAEIRELAPLLRLGEISWRSRYQADPETALCVLCARLSSPGRWAPLTDIYGRSESWLCTAFNDVCCWLAEVFGPVLHWHHQLTRYSRLAEFSAGVRRVGGVDGGGALWMAPFEAIAVHLAKMLRGRYTLGINGNMA
ncbi:hypothetical protein GMDG_02449 [Pseudogymnoascus destructans 20631-21]|uniref:Uncharacterized protein n=1 Tax=Pseudogymnoascus destructans (strain ATCC MYA-4855 / 20631-21) TaxID=658429 RepID=L8G281_PSED2|nr:hypothetical protein GMDG_02449 [Pseudogymnoascus destructans 20631-21]